MKTKQNRPILVIGKSRSYRASFQDAANLIVSNLKTLCVSLFPFPLAIGIVGAVLLQLAGAGIVSLAVGIVVFSFAVSMFCTAFCQMMKDFGKTQVLEKISWKKDFKAIALKSLSPFYLLLLQTAFWAALAIGTTVCIGLRPGWAVAISGAAVLIVVALCVPFNISLGCAWFSGLGFVKSALRGFTAMRHHYGPTLMLLFMSVIVIAVACIIGCTPLLILDRAVDASETAISFGDPTDMPSLIYVVRFILRLVLFSLMAFMLLLWLVPLYLHHFSMQKKDEERKKEQEKLQMTREAYKTARENYYLTTP